MANVSADINLGIQLKGSVGQLNEVEKRLKELNELLAKMGEDRPELINKQDKKSWEHNIRLANEFLGEAQAINEELVRMGVLTKKGEWTEGFEQNIMKGKKDRSKDEKQEMKKVKKLFGSMQEFIKGTNIATNSHVENINKLVKKISAASKAVDTYERTWRRAQVQAHADIDKYERTRAKAHAKAMDEIEKEAKAREKEAEDRIKLDAEISGARQKAQRQHEERMEKERYDKVTGSTGFTSAISAMRREEARSAVRKVDIGFDEIVTDDAIRDIKLYNDELKKLDEKYRRLSEDSKKVIDTDVIRRAKEGFQSFNVQAQKSAERIERIIDENSEMVNGKRVLLKVTEDVKKEFDAEKKILKQATTEMKRHKNTISGVTKEQNNWTKGQTKTIEQLEKTSQATIRLAKSMKGFQLTVSQIRNALLLYHFAFDPIINAIKASTRAFLEFERNMEGVTRVSQKMDISTNATKGAIEELTKDGILEVSAAARGMAELLRSGLGLDDATQLMKTFKDFAAFGRKGTMDFSSALETAAEGFRNLNSRTLDNVGLTTNVDVLLARGADRLDRLVSSLSDAEKHQILFNEILREGNMVLGDANKLTETATGRFTKMDTSMERAARSFGDFLDKVGALKVFTDVATILAERLELISSYFSEKTLSPTELFLETLRKTGELTSEDEKRLTLEIAINKAGEETNKILKGRLDLNKQISEAGKVSFREQKAIMVEASQGVRLPPPDWLKDASAIAAAWHGVSVPEEDLKPDAYNFARGMQSKYKGQFVDQTHLLADNVETPPEDKFARMSRQDAKDRLAQIKESQFLGERFIAENSAVGSDKFSQAMREEVSTLNKIINSEYLKLDFSYPPEVVKLLEDLREDPDKFAEQDVKKIKGLKEQFEKFINFRNDALLGYAQKEKKALKAEAFSARALIRGAEPGSINEGEEFDKITAQYENRMQVINELMQRGLVDGEALLKNLEAIIKGKTKQEEKEENTIALTKRQIREIKETTEATERFGKATTKWQQQHNALLNQKAALEERIRRLEIPEGERSDLQETLEERLKIKQAEIDASKIYEDSLRNTNTLLSTTEMKIKELKGKLFDDPSLLREFEETGLNENLFRQQAEGRGKIILENLKAAHRFREKLAVLTFEFDQKARIVAGVTDDELKLLRANHQAEMLGLDLQYNTERTALEQQVQNKLTQIIEKGYSDKEKARKKAIGILKGGIFEHPDVEIGGKSVEELMARNKLEIESKARMSIFDDAGSGGGPVKLKGFDLQETQEVLDHMEAILGVKVTIEELRQAYERLNQAQEKIFSDKYGFFGTKGTWANLTDGVSQVEDTLNNASRAADLFHKHGMDAAEGVAEKLKLAANAAQNVKIMMEQIQALEDAKGLALINPAIGAVAAGVGIIASVYSMFNEAEDKEKKRKAAQDTAFGATISRGPEVVNINPVLTVNSEHDTIFSEDGLGVVHDNMLLMMQQAIDNGELDLTNVS